jgi:hypothetical protein
MTKKRWSILAIITVILFAAIIFRGCQCVFSGTCQGVTPQSQVEGPIKQEWIAHYHNGEAKAIAIDENGDICIAGSGGIIKYNGAGQKLWVSSASGASMAIDTEGNLYVAGLGYSGGSFPTELSVVKCSADGKGLWSNHRAGNYYNWVSMALDKQGNVCVAVDTGDYVNNTVCIFKYSGIDGTELWMASYDRPAPESPSLVVDGSANSYVAGANNLTKYNSDGRELWSIILEEGDQWAGCLLALDPQGNLCVATWNNRIAKYYPNGSQIWTASYSSMKDSAIAVDELGNIYLSSKLKTVKYSINGTLLWSVAGGGNLAVDSAGNAYVIGLDDKWWITTKYSSRGTEIWTARYWDGSEYTGSIYSEPSDIAIDASGNVYVTGKSIYKICSGGLVHIDSGPVKYTEYTTIKYSQQ